MPCEHLRELYNLCEKHDLRISSQDAIRVVCRQCEEQEVCPSSLTDGENVLKVNEEDSAAEAKSGHRESGEPKIGASETGSPEVRDSEIGDRRPR